MTEQFKQDVREGLSAEIKTLPSKYFYDEKGDQYFVDIMAMPEYYLTRAEMEIFRDKTTELVAALQLSKEHYFELIELGAGDGTKTIHLLNQLCADGFKFDYFPVDISEHALDGLEQMLSRELPELNVKKQQGDYFDVLSSLKHSEHLKVILFLGSNIGNMTDRQAGEFLSRMGATLNPGDVLFLGVDLMKPKDIVLPAYHDREGITKAFNLNLLHRINRELGGNFNVDAFEHAPEYNEREGIARSFLKSLKNQEVYIASLEETFYFREDEKIYMEISRKYNDEVLRDILSGTGLKIRSRLLDSKGYFADYIIERT